MNVVGMNEDNRGSLPVVDGINNTTGNNLFSNDDVIPLPQQLDTIIMNVSDSSILSTAAKTNVTVVTSSHYVHGPDDSPCDPFCRPMRNSSRILSDTSNSNDNRLLDTLGIILLTISLVVVILGILRYLWYREKNSYEHNARIRREAIIQELTNRPVVVIQLSEHQHGQQPCQNLNDPNILTPAEFDEMLLHTVYSQGTKKSDSKSNGNKSAGMDAVAPNDSTGSVVTTKDSQYEVDPESPVVTKKIDNDGKSDDCSICLDEFRNNDNVTIIPQCLHRFHTKCVREWLLDTKSTYCPLCKTIIKNEV